MKKWLIALVAVPALLVGCGEKEVPKDSGQDEDIQIPEVAILTPTEVAVDEPIELAAQVTQGKENIDDATVEFEVWESGNRDDSQMLEGKFEKDGVYKAAITFNHDGVYFMYAHTTANSIHIMPKQQVTAGEPDLSTVVPDDKQADTMEMNNEQEKNNEHQH